jgi:hypothetical protein
MYIAHQGTLVVWVDSGAPGSGEDSSEDLPDLSTSDKHFMHKYRPIYYYLMNKLACDIH